MSLNTNIYMEIILVIVLNFAGALSNDYYNTMTDRDDKIRIGRVLLGTITGALVSFIIAKRIDMIKNDNSLFLFFCYLLGIGGFKIFEWLRTMDIVKLLLYIFKIDIDKVNKTENKSDSSDER